MPNMSASSPDVNGLGERPAKRQKKMDHDQLPGTRRVAACQACRLRKVKCDKKRPCCALCRASGVECEYLNESNDKLTLDTATQTILERLDLLRSELDTIKRSAASFPPPQPSAQSFQGHHLHQQQQQLHDIPIDATLTGPSSTTSYEPSRDFLRIPPHRASADTILQWDVFEGRYAPNALIGVLFRPDQSQDEATPGTTISGPGQSPSDLVTSTQGLTPPDDEQIPSLVDRFLTNVYTKNPILDVERLVKHGRRCAERGVGWDGWSCLVLLACALGSVAKPFDRSLQLSKPVPAVPGSGGEQSEAGAGKASARLHARELQQGDSCFTLACRRLGSLKYSMLGAQCHFFAGVYLMYTLRPIQSWHYFYQASIFCQFYLRMTHGLSDSFAEVLSSPSQRAAQPVYPAGDSASRKARRIEQSLYWSCFKSECEFRVELPLPQSELCLGEYPNLFPSPPSPVSLTETNTTVTASTTTTIEGGLVSPDQSMGHSTPTAGENLGFNGGILGSTTAALTDEELELRQHAMRLCREEESWYYYLTEIALRRISNRIINTFFPSPSSSSSSSSSAAAGVPPAAFWLSNMRPLLRMAQEFEAQVRSWSAHLPPAMQQYETSSIIRAPHLNYESESAGGNVSRELSWAIDNRLLEMLTWLYQPFLYYFIHHGGAADANHGADGAEGLKSGADIDSLLNPWSPSASTTTHSVDFTTVPPTSSVPGQAAVGGAGGPLDAEEVGVLNGLITSGIECCLKTIDVRARYHRHHGLWYDLRSVMSACVILLAVVKSGNAAWIPGGEMALWGAGVRSPGAASASSRGGGVEAPIGGKIGKALWQFSFWAAEAPDMMRQKQVLEGMVRDIRGY